MMDAYWTQTTPPDAEPVSLNEAKAHARVYTDLDDAELTAFIAASRQMTEKATRRQLVTATWELVLGGFPPARFELPRPPFQAVSAITYYDLDNAEQTLSSDVYTTVPGSVFGLVELKYGQSWPSTYDRPDAVTVTFTAGYGNAAAVPPLLKQSILMRVAHWYTHKESTIEATLMQVPDGPRRIDNMFKAPSVPRIWTW